MSFFDQETLQALLVRNPQITQQELASALNCKQKTICNQLLSLGKVWKFGKWVPHKLIENTISSLLLSRQNRLPFLEQIVTRDEKWVLYVNLLIWRDSHNGRTKAKRRSPRQIQTCMRKRWCVFGGILKEFFIINSYQSTKPYYKRSV